MVEVSRRDEGLTMVILKKPLHSYAKFGLGLPLVFTLLVTVAIPKTQEITPMVVSSGLDTPVPDGLHHWGYITSRIANSAGPVADGLHHWP
jgi:hypothetical protein